MCGISAIVALQNRRSSASAQEDEADQERLYQRMQKSLDLIKHRGPDSSGIWISDDQKIVLGHNRLAINDLSTSGGQPFHSPDGSVHAVVNGELYDYKELKDELSQTIGYQFSSNSDSEIVLALYQAYGPDFVNYLRGEFALCLYDETKKLFIAARDRYGIKPLSWTVQNENLLIGAEIKAFIPLDWQPEWDVKSILEAGWNFDDRTLLKDVRKVRPGYYITCGASGNIKHHQYWDMDHPDKTACDTRSEKDIVQ
ncbi:hypothetical protein LTR37_020966, partial [Vermiconidia calcicola]